MKSFIRTASIFSIIAILFYSCESNHFFKSEKKLKSNLEGTWNRVQISGSEPIEQWTFLGGTVSISQVKQDSTIIISGSYSIDATLTAPFLKIEDLSRDSIGFPTDYDIKWSIVQLDERVLDIVADIPTGGLAQIEFTKQ
jgi:hypothetical protein